MRGSILGVLDPSLLKPGYNALHLVFLVVPDDLNPLGRQSLEAAASHSLTPLGKLVASLANVQGRTNRFASLQEDLLKDTEAVTSNSGLKRPLTPNL